MSKKSRKFAVAKDKKTYYYEFGLHHHQHWRKVP